ncbi:MAG: hypothetical protein LC118_00065 [Dehalococcoidia bacterium]|nr:hypothetical protein [Dehalococcoidia bacterium]
MAFAWPSRPGHLCRGEPNRQSFGRDQARRITEPVVEARLGNLGVCRQDTAGGRAFEECLDRAVEQSLVEPLEECRQGVARDGGERGAERRVDPEDGHVPGPGDSGGCVTAAAPWCDRLAKWRTRRRPPGAGGVTAIGFDAQRILTAGDTCERCEIAFAGERCEGMDGGSRGSLEVVTGTNRRSTGQPEKSVTAARVEIDAVGFAADAVAIALDSG